MPSPERAYAGLILPDAEDPDLRPVLDAAATALDCHDPRAVRPARIDASRCTVYGAGCAVRVGFEPDSDFGPRIVLDILHRPGIPPDENRDARILSDTVLHALGHCDADIIEWYAPDVLIGRSDFIRLRSYVSVHRGFGPQEARETAAAGRIRDAIHGADLPVASQAPQQATAPTLTAPLGDLCTRFGSSSPAERRLGAAGWAVTATLSVVAFPVAAALSVIGLVRGMDFRLATQALSVTMLFVALGDANALQRVVYGILH